MPRWKTEFSPLITKSDGVLNHISNLYMSLSPKLILVAKSKTTRIVKMHPFPGVKIDFAKRRAMRWEHTTWNWPVKMEP